MAMFILYFKVCNLQNSMLFKTIQYSTCLIENIDFFNLKIMANRISYCSYVAFLFTTSPVISIIKGAVP